MKDRKPGLLVNFGQFPCSWIRIRIPNKDLDPGQTNNADPCESGSTTLDDKRVIQTVLKFFSFQFQTSFNEKPPAPRSSFKHEISSFSRIEGHIGLLDPYPPTQLNPDSIHVRIQNTG